MTFEALGLHASIIKALTEAGYTKPTTVQEQAIPAAMQGRDLLVSSQTGSGKTAAFMLPALHKFASAEHSSRCRQDPESGSQAARARGERPRFQPAQPKMLVLTPTRELALQVTTATDKYGSQLRRITRSVDPGRHALPEADAIAGEEPGNPGRDAGPPDRPHGIAARSISRNCRCWCSTKPTACWTWASSTTSKRSSPRPRKRRQTMLFSATLDGVVGNMAKRITQATRWCIQIAGSASKHENIQQRVHFVDDLSHKNRLLDHLLRDDTLDQAVVFTATKRDADTIADRLNIAGFAAAALHGDMHQGARNRTLDALRRGQVRVLVATDVAARGIDVAGHHARGQLRSAEIPGRLRAPHRPHRPRRPQRSWPISLVNHAEGMNVKRIERFTKQLIPVDVIEGFEPKKTASHPRPSAQARRLEAGRQSWRQARHRGRSFSKPAAPRKEGGFNKGSRFGDSGARRSYGDR